jgi:hypothetical protein
MLGKKFAFKIKIEIHKEKRMQGGFFAKIWRNRSERFFLSERKSWLIRGKHHRLPFDRRKFRMN